MKNKVSKTKAAKQTFVNAVNSTSKLSLAKGLSALKKTDKAKVSCTDTRLLEGSSDIDAAYRASEPNSARWDYVIGYAQKVYFLEIHPASTCNVSEMVKKMDWLKKFLKNDGTKLAAIKADAAYHWVASSKINILKGSKEYKSCVQLGIIPKAMLNL